jgi:hypothetical protein
MDTLNIIIIAAAAFGLIALAWLGGYEIGQASGIDTERQLANRRVNALLDELNKYKPKLRYRSVDARKVGKRKEGK